MEAAAMGGVDAGDAAAIGLEEGAGEAGIGAALGAMAMEDVGAEGLGGLVDAAGAGEVRDRDLSFHRHTDEAEGEDRSELGEELLLEGAAGGRIADDADLMAGRRLGAAEI